MTCNIYFYNRSRNLNLVPSHNAFGHARVEGEFPIEVRNSNNLAGVWSLTYSTNIRLFTLTGSFLHNNVFSYCMLFLKDNIISLTLPSISTISKIFSVKKKLSNSSDYVLFCKCNIPLVILCHRAIHSLLCNQTT